MRFAVTRAGGALLAFAANTAHAVVCVVPSATHPTIQQAVDTVACTSIELAAASFPESVLVERSLVLGGAGPGLSTIQGRVEVKGAISVSLDGLSIGNGCAEPGLQILDGADVTTADVVIGAALLACPAFPDRLFANGFE